MEIELNKWIRVCKNGESPLLLGKFSYELSREYDFIVRVGDDNNVYVYVFPFLDEEKAEDLEKYRKEI